MPKQLFKFERKQSYRIPAEGQPVKINPKDGKEFTLEEMQKVVGGHIELACRLETGHTLWCDEEGKLKGKTPNLYATVLYTGQGFQDVIVGDCLLIAEGQVS